MLISNHLLPYTPYNNKNYKFPKTEQINIVGKNINKNRANTLPNYQFCNPAYYTINFTGAKLDVQMQRLEAEEFPSEYLYNYAKGVLAQNPKTQKTIFDIHGKFYENLFNASSLEDVKAHYPEFANVIDAKDYVKMTDYKDMPYGIRKIYDGEIDEITIEDLTLDLLKKVYSGLRDRNNPDKYYGLANRTIDKMIDALNIKKFNEHYSKAYRSCNPENALKMSASKKKYFENPENIEKNKQAIKATYDKHPEKRQAARERTKAHWNAMTPEEKAACQDKMHAPLRTDEGRAKTSQRSKQMWQNEEFKQKQQLVFIARKEAWDNHPEIKAVMSAIAKEEFPLLGIYIKVPESKRTKAQNIYVSKYFTRINELLPDAMKLIGEEMKENYSRLKKDSEFF